MSSADQAKRLATFALTEAEVASLASLAPFARDRLPALLERLHTAFVQWPAIRDALRDPEVHRLRLAHWSRVICGQLGNGFEESARALAQAFFRQGVPAYAVAICHATVLQAVAAELGRDRPRRRFGQAPVNDPAPILAKLAWLDLEVLQESYASSETEIRNAAMTAMADTIERETGTAVTQVGSLTTDLSAIAQSMGVTASSTGRAATQAVTTATEALDKVTQVNDATTQLSTSVDEINHQVAKSRDASSAAVRSGEAAEASIQTLSAQVVQIGQIAKAIADIAAKTNLLALNATIEAARAGDVGRGFAVVAGEVKGLASQTKASTESIAGQIASIEAATRQAAERVRSMVGTIGELERINVAVAGAVEQQSAATAGIARTMTETAAAVTTMADQTRQVSAAAVETDTQAADVRSRAASLQDEVTSLRGTIVRMIRTSTDGVDRRRELRHAVDLPARFTPAVGAAVDVRVIDLSGRGALLKTAGPAARPSLGPGTLMLAGLQVPARVVRTTAADQVSVELAPASAEQAERLLVLLPTGTGAAAA